MKLEEKEQLLQHSTSQNPQLYKKLTVNYHNLYNRFDAYEITFPLLFPISYTIPNIVFFLNKCLNQVPVIGVVEYDEKKKENVYHDLSQNKFIKTTVPKYTFKDSSYMHKSGFFRKKKLIEHITINRTKFGEGPEVHFHSQNINIKVANDSDIELYQKNILDEESLKKFIHKYGSAENFHKAVGQLLLPLLDKITKTHFHLDF